MAAAIELTATRSLFSTTQKRFRAAIRPVAVFGRRAARSCDARTGEGWSCREERSVLDGIVEEKGKRDQRRCRKLFCRAEGIEGLVLGGGGGEGGSFLLPERMKVVALVAFVMCLCNADRVVMSVAVVPLAARHGWSSSFLGIVQVCPLLSWIHLCVGICVISLTAQPGHESSFLWGYICSSIVGGFLVDKYGGKRVLACGVMLWSLATFLTPWAAGNSTAMLLAARAIFGVAEGVAMPSMNTFLSSWFPANERATAVGISMAGFHLGNVVGLLVTPLMMSNVGISGPFSLFAALGFLWLSVWALRVTNNPRDSPLISKAELLLIQRGKTDPPWSKSGELPPLGKLFSKLPTWAIVFANVTNNWGYFVLLSWMPVYFKTVFEVNLKQAAWFSAVPWGVMAFSGYIAGAASDFLMKSSYSVTTTRKIMQSIGFIGPGVSLLCLNFTKTPTMASVLLAAALSLSSFSQAGFLLNMQDIAPQYAGLLHGISNSAGTFAAIVSTIGTGYFVQWLGSFQAFLTLTAALYFVTTIFWNIFATGERVF